MEKMYYLFSGGYVGNAMSWWRPEGKGYTTDITQAGKFSEEDARNACKDTEKGVTAWPVDKLDLMEEAHKTIIDSQFVDWDVKKVW